MAIGSKTQQKPKVNQSQWEEPDRSDNANAINILEQNKYTFCRDSYYGTGGFFTGYAIVPHALETTYKERRQLACYNNYVRPIVDAMVNPIYKDPIERKGSESVGNTLYMEFVANCDGKGTPLDTFMNSIGKMAALNGVEFIVVDNTPFDGTVEDAIANRKYPYVYSAGADSIVDYKLDKNGIENYIMIATDPIIEKKVTYDAAIKWTSIDSTKMIKKNNVWEVYEAPVVHRLGVIPVIPVYSVPLGKNEFLPEPRLYDICRANWYVYNLDSERREVYRKQGFSLLAIQTDLNGSEVNLRVGTGNAFFVSKDVSNMPQYVSPNPAIPEGILKESQEMIKRLYQLAEQSGVTGVADASSGLAKEWDFQAHGFVLSYISAMLADAEIKVQDIFGLCTTNEVDIESKYPTTFEPRQKNVDYDILDKALQANICPTMNKEISLAMAKVLFPKMPEETLSKIAAELEQTTMPMDGGNVA